MVAMTAWPFRVTPPLLAVVDALVRIDPDHRVHGWALAEITGQTSPNVYRALERLRAAGWVSYKWEDNSGSSKPARRLYWLAEDERANAKALLAKRGRG